MKLESVIHPDCFLVLTYSRKDYFNDFTYFNVHLLVFGSVLLTLKIIGCGPLSYICLLAYVLYSNLYLPSVVRFYTLAIFA